MQGLDHAHHVIENDDGLALAQSLLLDDVMLQVDEVGRLVAEVVSAETVEHQADPLLQLTPPGGLRVLQDLIRPVLNKQTVLNFSVDTFQTLLVCACVSLTSV